MGWTRSCGARNTERLRDTDVEHRNRSRLAGETLSSGILNVTIPSNQGFIKDLFVHAAQADLGTIYGW